MKDFLHGVGRLLDEWLFPQPMSCICCGTELKKVSNDLRLCGGCMQALERLSREQEEREREEPIPPAEGLSYIHCAFPYKEEAKALVLRLKFGRLRDAARPLVLGMLALSAGEEDLIVPVPTTRRRRRERGFNQAALLAGQLARRYGMKADEHLLVRTDDGEEQSALSREKRIVNLNGCMAAKPGAAGHRILLIDDVYTTGSTAREAARALKSAGALSVGMLSACCAWYRDEDSMI